MKVRCLHFACALVMLSAAGRAAGQTTVGLEPGTARAHLTPEGCEVVHPFGESVDAGGATRTALQGTDTTECPAIKMAADGVAALEILIDAPIFTNWVNLSFCSDIDSCPEFDSTVDRGEFSSSRCEERAADLTLIYEPKAAPRRAWYVVPDEFNGPNSDPAQATREVTIHIRTLVIDGLGVRWDIPVELSRPPLVLVHGLWSSADTWRFDLVDDDRLPVVTRADYSATNAASFDENHRRAVVSRSILEASNEMRKQDRVAARVDLIGHSMGGLLGRKFSTSELGQTKLCAAVGPIRKLITLDSPHFGAGLANVAWYFSQDPLIGALAAKKGFRLDQGAIADLRVGSLALQELGPVNVPSHALIGLGGDDFLAALPDQSIALLLRKMILWHPEVDDVGDMFDNESHDLIVSESSQEGNLPLLATSAFPYPDGVHFGIPSAGVPGATGSNAYGERIFELLNAPIEWPEWGYFPGVVFLEGAGSLALDSRSNLDTREPPLPQRGEDTSVTIISPPSGTMVESGQEITVTVSVLSNQPIQSVDVWGPGEMYGEAVEAPYVLSVEVPAESDGAFQITATAFTTAGVLFGSEPVTLIASPQAALTGIEIEPGDRVYLAARGVGREEPLRLKGLYADGIERALDPADASWSSSDAAVATVSPDGVVLGVAEGEAEVRATLGSRSTTATRDVVVHGGLPGIFGHDFDNHPDYDPWPWTEMVGTATVGDVGYCDTRGLEVSVTGQEPAFARSDDPEDEKIYFAGFYVRLESLAMGDGQEFDLFVAYDDEGNPQLKLTVLRSSGQSHLRWWLMTSAGVLETPPGEEIPLPAPWDFISVAWKRAESGAADGRLVLRIDGEEFEAATEVDNAGSRIDSVRLGAVDGLDLGTSGNFFLDYFTSRRDWWPSGFGPCGPALRRDPVRLHFGDVPVGQSGETREITVRSIGSEPVTVGAIDIEVVAGTEGESFALADLTCAPGGELPITLVPGQSCGLVVEFAPQEPGFVEAEATIVSDAVVVKPTSNPVELLGDGVAAAND